MYYDKHDYYIMVFGCVCLLVFLATIFINPKNSTKNLNPAESKVIDKDECKKMVDDLSQKLDAIRERLKKEDEKERGTLDDSKQKANW